MARLYNSRIDSWMDKAAVDNEDGLTVAQLMVRLNPHTHLILSIRYRTMKK